MDYDPKTQRVANVIAMILSVALVALILYSGRVPTATIAVAVAVGAIIGLLDNILFARGVRLSLLALAVGPFVVFIVVTSQLLAALCYMAGYLLVNKATLRLSGKTA